MINEQQEERAALFVLGVIQEAEQREFEAELRPAQTERLVPLAAR